MAQVKPKSNSIVTTLPDLAARTITFTVRQHAPLVLHLDKVSVENRTYAEFHGWMQRTVDAAALEAEPPPKGATPEVVARMNAARFDEKHDKMAAVIEHYESGSPNWGMARGPSGPRPLDAILVAAVAEFIGKEPDGARAFVEQGATKYGITGHAYLAKLAERPGVAAIADRMRAASVKADFDADADLEEAMRDAGE